LPSSLSPCASERPSRLRTDYIDVYWLHAWDFLTPVEEIMRALDDMVRAGKVLYLGISDAPAWIVGYANAIAEQRGWTGFSGLDKASQIGRGFPHDFIASPAILDQVHGNTYPRLAAHLRWGR